jgi:hypothetical protein
VQPNIQSQKGSVWIGFKIILTRSIFKSKFKRHASRRQKNNLGRKKAHREALLSNLTVPADSAQAYRYHFG